MSRDLLARRATPDLVAELRAAGVIDARQETEALRALAPMPWREWASLVMLAVGAALVVAGVVYFFAWNWAELGRGLKLAVAQSALVAGLGLAGWRGIDRLGGRVALLAATLLVGAVLAVYGQVYQTGADAWELFAAWAALTSAWAALSCFAPHLIAWLVIVNVAIATWWIQVGPSSGTMEDGAWLVLAILDVSALVAATVGAALGVSWLRPRWARMPLHAGTFALLAIATIAWVVDDFEGLHLGACGGLLAAATIATWIWHVRHEPDVSALAVATLATCVAAIAVVARWTFEVLDDADVAAWLLLGVFAVLITAAAAVALRGVARSLREDE